MSLPTRSQAFEVECREFAAEFPTPNVLQAIAYAESGRLSWEQIYGLFHNSLVKVTSN